MNKENKIKYDSSVKDLLENIKLNYKGLSFGISNENLWWGPSIRNSIMMSNHARGFKHISLNSTRPLKSFIGWFEFQLVSGRLESSGYTPPNPNYIYAVPICILPLIIKAFFDSRLGLFAHFITILLLGFLVPNSFEFIFLQFLVGPVSVLSVSELYKRANLFISVFQIVFVYIICYTAFHITREGNLSGFSFLTIGLFIINGLATLFVQPLIYLYEKIFKLVSDVSLLELSDTNSKLLRQLSDKAPGTFHHSLQVANLAEASAIEIKANVLLTRVGALYHDIGKMNNPTYFSENQITKTSPHKRISPVESAKIIINHVNDGIQILSLIHI